MAQPEEFTMQLSYESCQLQKSAAESGFPCSAAVAVSINSTDEDCIRAHSLGTSTAASLWIVHRTKIFCTGGAAKGRVTPESRKNERIARIDSLTRRPEERLRGSKRRSIAFRK
jgi:hypothetical protein